MAEGIEFLKKRSKEFYENAKSLFRKRKYNLSAFNLEQSCQLFLKYLIAKKVGDWPKTHYLKEKF
jgi:HEPN domain-containing protein